MRRTRIAGAVLVVRVLLALALLPLMAYAADDGAAGYEGIYAGIGDGVGTDGGGGSAAVTVWVEDLGDSARFTIQILEYGITVAAEGPVTDDGSAISVPITVDSAGVSGSATITMTRGEAFWIMTAEGTGNALGYDGMGTLSAEQVSTGFGVPSIGDQIGDMIGAITGGPDKAAEQATAPPYIPPASATSSTAATKVAAGINSAGNTGSSATQPGTLNTPPPGGGSQQPAPTTGGTTAEQPAPATGGTTAEQPAAGTTGGSQSGTATTTSEPVEPSPLAPAAPEPPFTDFNRIGAAALAAAILLLEIILA